MQVINCIPDRGAFLHCIASELLGQKRIPSGNINLPGVTQATICN